MKLDPLTLTVGLVGTAAAVSVGAVALTRRAQAAPPPGVTAPPPPPPAPPAYTVLPDGTVIGPDGRPIRSTGDQVGRAVETGAAALQGARTLYDLGRELWGGKGDA